MREDADSAYTIYSPKDDTEKGIAKREDADSAYTIYSTKDDASTA